MTGSHEVRGSSPLSSTNEIKGLADIGDPFFFGKIGFMTIYDMATEFVGAAKALLLSIATKRRQKNASPVLPQCPGGPNPPDTGTRRLSIVCKLSL